MRDLPPVAIIGAGPAGSTLARLLAENGREVVLFHDPAGKGKHCAGGIPSRVVDEFPPLAKLDIPCRKISRIMLLSPWGLRCPLNICRPIRVFERSLLDEALRQEALRAGAKLVPRRARSFRRDGNRWVVTADDFEFGASFLVGADGATGMVRRGLSRPLPLRALSLCAGYYLVPAEEETIVVGYLRRRASYAWVFPRPGLASTGIGAPLKGSDANSLRRELREWLEQQFPDHPFDYSQPYASLVSTYAGPIGPVTGDKWALVGDAAGVAEPVTREGIFFSMKSAQILAATLIDGRPEEYSGRLGQFLIERHRLALLLRKYAFRAFLVERMFWVLRKSGPARSALEDFFSGSLDYGVLARALGWAAARA